MNLLTILLTTVFSALTPLTRAQISVPGIYRQLVLKSLQMSVFAVEMREYTMPEQNNAQLLAQALANEIITPLSRKEIRRNYTEGPDEITYTGRLPKAVPFTFGKVVPLSVDMNKDGEGEWVINEENQTRMWRFRVSSKGAYSISIYFKDLNLSPSSELYVIGREDTLGAFTAQNNKESRSFGIAPVAGDFLILEYIEPLNRPVDFVPSSIVVNHIVHGFRPSPFSIKSGNDISGACNINVACSEGAGKNNAINSVALLIGRDGASFCTGTMVNNAENDGRQLFLTAEHCIGDSDVTNFMIGFHYQYKYCSSAFETKPQTNTVHGTKLLDKSGVTDYAVLEVVESIPNEWDVYMSGWDATNTKARTGSFYGIHHPSGDVKKVSLATSQLDLVRLMDMGMGANFWRVAKWEKGVTEPGSSGSPLFDSNGLVIGHLLGGESSCATPKSPDYYGALSKDWLIAGNPITKHLNPRNRNMIQIQGAPLKQLRGNSRPTPQPSPIDPAVSISTIALTKTITRTSIVTQTIAKTTQLITSRVIIPVTGPTITLTRDVVKMVTLPVTITQTFTRIPPPIVKTVYVTKVKS